MEKRCPQCGALLTLSQRLCNSCGSRQLETQSQKSIELPEVNEELPEEKVQLAGGLLKGASPSKKSKRTPDDRETPPDLNQTFYRTNPPSESVDFGNKSSIFDSFFGCLGCGIKVFLVLFVLLFLAAIAITPHRRPRRLAPEKACYVNMRVILGAVEMYNMDNSSMITSINDGDTQQGKLISGGYLKSPVNRPEKDCFYDTGGDLTTSGQIKCQSHGTVN
ncbi:hypothetical protein HYY75_07180 [bacterium]|nr:hypothetical protein [bacterium]